MITKIQSILFVASKPLTVGQLAKTLGVSSEDMVAVIQKLILKYNRSDSGIHIFVNGDLSAKPKQVLVQMGTNPQNSGAIEGFIKDEVGGELTKAQLETLTVVAYRGSITRPELEEIRGVNCAVILRNLLIKGLIDEKQDDEKLAMVYNISFNALSHLGVTSVSELPNYEELSRHKHIESFFESENSCYD
jgi:segregation and condensation protein B